MRASNSHIEEVIKDYDLESNTVLRQIDLHHSNTTGNEACLDHATFVALYEMRDAFIEHWEHTGLQALEPLRTRQYPAEHIALIRSDIEYQACDSMIGLSVSTDSSSPINMLLSNYQNPSASKLPGNLQHVAVGIDPAIDMDSFVQDLSEKGIAFMTPVLLTVQNSARTELRQAFTNCMKPYGHFVELIQRKSTSAPLTQDLQDELFNINQIDELYKLYDTHSKKLMKSV